MSKEKPRESTPQDASAENVTTPVQAQADPFELTDEQLSKVSGGRVKTSDKQQKAVLDFVKG